jgi:hypothetical protein
MALRSQCCAVGEAAADSVKYLSQQDLLRYRDEIVPQLIAMKKFNVMIYLPFSPEIGKLMTDKAKNYMNQRDDIFLKRFRMGDPKGKSELIAKLNSDLRGDRIESKFAASPLGIIGDRESIIALLQRLPTASPETKFQIIKAIWRNFPDDECWLKCAPEIMTGKSRELTDDFYLDVSDWAEKNFLIKLDFSQTSPDVGEYYHPESHQRLKPSTGEKP